MTDKKESILQFSERLKSIVPAGSGRDFAKRAGIGYSTVHNYLQGVSSPTLENLVSLARAGNVSVEWLATGEEFRGLTLALDREVENDRVLKIPFLNKDGFLFLDYEAFLSIQEKAGRLAALQVDSDVMEPTFGVGSVLVIDQGQKELRDSKVVVMRKAGSYLYKRVQIVSEGYSLISDNKQYNAVTITDESLCGFEVLGTVISILNILG
ncbi:MULTISPECIES: XRE family transcriptional regulator [Aeromonas]|jgi:phage repressor protein C with HTH and peptisase S24 domain|uniref:XRE family transcriptional regulator n=1 Tax=Aeromonas TaxID=642 RepID=UPI001F4B93D6|nr:LexA family transcriptional regulator [Aeromonas sp. MR16]MCH7370744.1 LexA family transcriptional regulator [Aeromonas sp. MR16]